ncbi:hypothetical protein SNEBB_005995 [Seison nebaliae]|nr:hypothetical protein SNEBB_005995 [Seison nebaliae]
MLTTNEVFQLTFNKSVEKQINKYEKKLREFFQLSHFTKSIRENKIIYTVQSSNKRFEKSTFKVYFNNIIKIEDHSSEICVSGGWISLLSTQFFQHYLAITLGVVVEKRCEKKERLFMANTGQLVDKQFLLMTQNTLKRLRRKKVGKSEISFDSSILAIVEVVKTFRNYDVKNITENVNNSFNLFDGKADQHFMKYLNNFNQLFEMKKQKEKLPNTKDKLENEIGNEENLSKEKTKLSENDNEQSTESVEDLSMLLSNLSFDLSQGLSNSTPKKQVELIDLTKDDNILKRKGNVVELKEEKKSEEIHRDNKNEIFKIPLKKPENFVTKDVIDSKFSCPSTKIGMENFYRFPKTSTNETKFQKIHDHNANWKNKKRINDKNHRRNRREQFRFNKRNLTYSRQNIQRSKTVENKISKFPQRSEQKSQQTKRTTIPSNFQFGENNYREVFPALQNINNRRIVVVDGMNIINYGRQFRKNQDGQLWRLCSLLEYFALKNHVIVVMPRKVFSNFSNRNENDENKKSVNIIVGKLSEDQLVLTPHKVTDGRTISPYDDRYVLDIALRKNAIVISNDSFRDLCQENADYALHLTENLVGYAFMEKYFMPATDPNGRHGKKLNELLE